MTIVRGTVENWRLVGQASALVFREGVGEAEGTDEVFLETGGGRVVFSEGVGRLVDAIEPVPPVGKRLVEFAVTGAIAVDPSDALVEKIPVRLSSEFENERDPVAAGKVEFGYPVGKLADAVTPVESGTVMLPEGVGTALKPVPGVSVELAVADEMLRDTVAPVDSGIEAFAEGVGRPPEAVSTGEVEFAETGGNPEEPVSTGNCVELIGVVIAVVNGTDTLELDDAVGIKLEAVIFVVGMPEDRDFKLPKRSPVS